MLTTTGYTISVISPYAFADTLDHVRDELRHHGFNPLCEIDVRQTMRDRLGIETEPYVILGVCNPGLAHRALEVEPELGAFLPWNVVVREDEGLVRVSAVDPEQVAALTGNEELAPVAAEVGHWLRTILDNVTD
jgi:uncharacterized protein (DUF302 family)